MFFDCPNLKAGAIATSNVFENLLTPDVPVLVGREVGHGATGTVYEARLCMQPSASATASRCSHPLALKASNSLATDGAVIRECELLQELHAQKQLRSTVFEQVEACVGQVSTSSLQFERPGSALTDSGSTSILLNPFVAPENALSSISQLKVTVTGKSTQRQSQIESRLELDEDKLKVAQAVEQLARACTQLILYGRVAPSDLQYLIQTQWIQSNQNAAAMVLGEPTQEQTSASVVDKTSFVSLTLIDLGENRRISSLQNPSFIDLMTVRSFLGEMWANIPADEGIADKYVQLAQRAIASEVQAFEAEQEGTDRTRMGITNGPISDELRAILLDEIPVVK